VLSNVPTMIEGVISGAYNFFAKNTVFKISEKKRTDWFREKHI